MYAQNGTEFFEEFKRIGGYMQSETEPCAGDNSRQRGGAFARIFAPGTHNCRYALYADRLAYGGRFGYNHQ